MKTRLSIGTNLKQTGIIFLLLLLVPASASATTRASCASLVKRWDRITYLEFITSAPFLARFDFERGTLRYIADRHKEPAATFNLVFRTIESARPDLVILEGLASTLGVTPAEGMKKFVNKTQVQLSGAGWASDFAAFAAYSRGIDFMGGEPSVKDVLESPLLDPFTREDRVGFLLLRDFTYYRRKNPNLSWEQILRNTSAGFGFREKFEPQSFVSWFETKTGHAWYPNMITRQETEVDCSPTAKFLKRLACEMIWFRDVHLVDLLNREFNHYRNILVVYGAGHYVQQQEGLTAQFGPATLETP